LTAIIPFLIDCYFPRYLHSTAFFLHPLKEVYEDLNDLPSTTTHSVREIFIVFGGNAALSLDWTQFLINFHVSNDASANQPSFLLIDYPGYGFNSGKPSPDSILDGTKQAVHSLLRHLRMTPAQAYSNTRFHCLGHSLGSAACLQFVNSMISVHARPSVSPAVSSDSSSGAFSASNNHSLSSSLSVADSTLRIRFGQIILLSPFTSMLEMAKIVVGKLPLLDKLLTHKWDNILQLQQISIKLFQQSREASSSASPKASLSPQRQKDLRIVIIHGRKDEIVPFNMGVELASLRLPRVNIEFIESVESSHNDIMDNENAQISKLVMETTVPFLHWNNFKTNDESVNSAAKG
jgi:pimeloyl-ACP methyl ester carboxylesterase